MSVKVLILEDNPVARTFLSRVVRESFSDVGEIVEVSDLDAARRLLGHPAGGKAAARGEAFQLIMVDLELPDGSGLELLTELSQYPATRIVTTLYSDDEHLFPALQCGADGYLLKEDRFEVLVEELQKIVRGQPPLSPAVARRLLTHFRTSESVPGGAPPQAPAPAPAVLDHERLTPYAQALNAEFAAMVTEHAQAQGYTLIGPVEVTMVRVADLGTGRPGAGAGDGVADAHGCRGAALGPQLGCHGQGADRGGGALDPLALGGLVCCHCVSPRMGPAWCTPCRES